MNYKHSFISEWISFANNSEYSLIKKYLKMSQLLEYPHLNITKYIQKIKYIGNAIKNVISEKKQSKIQDLVIE